jgi:Ser/Thr protein kinase RdoA (MazF antagonist)
MFAGLPGRERLSGVFDFYFAGTDTFVFDWRWCSTTGASTWTAAGWTCRAPRP